MSSVKQQTIKGVIWSGIEKLANQGLRFLIGIVLARLLPPSDFGLVAMLAIFYSISNTFIDSGFGTALIRKQNRTERDFTTVFIFNVVISIIFYFILFAIAPWVGVFFKTPILCPLLRVQSISLIFNGLMAVLDAKLTIELNFKAIAQRSMLSSIVSGCVGIILAYWGWGVWALVYQTITFSLVNLIFVWGYCKWKPNLIFSWDSFKDLGSFGSKLLAAGLLNTLYANLTPLAIGRFYTAKDLGFYKRGAEFAQMPNGVCLSVLQKVTLPIFSTIQDEESHLLSVYRKYIKITSMFLIFFSILLAALSKPTILLLLTNKWTESIIFLRLFCFAVMFSHINTINLSLLQVKGRSDLFLRLEIIKKTIATLILFAAIPFGVLAICISKIVYDQIAIVINTYYSGKLFNMGYFSQLKDFIGYFFASIGACIPAYLITLTNFSYIVQLILGIVSAISIYYLLLRKNVLMIEIIDLVKDKLQNTKK